MINRLLFICIYYLCMKNQSKQNLLFQFSGFPCALFDLHFLRVSAVVIMLPGANPVMSEYC